MAGCLVAALPWTKLGGGTRAGSSPPVRGRGCGDGGGMSRKRKLSTTPQEDNPSNNCTSPPQNKNKKKKRKLEVASFKIKLEDDEEVEEAARKNLRNCDSPPFRPWNPQQEEPLSLVSRRGAESPTGASDSLGSCDVHTVTSTSATSCRRANYKNMTRERRIEANARERSRVHTISAAFETLRRAVPAYSHNQKLSKLSVLRIAASYILTLSRVIGEDYSEDGSQPSLEECVDRVSNTIQSEGKLKKK